jgi:hypothetical protein
MKALIDTRFNRICELAEQEFPVAPDLIWVDVPEDTTVNDTYVDGEVVKFSPPTILPAPTLIEQILNNPDELAKLKIALGV